MPLTSSAISIHSVPTEFPSIVDGKNVDPLAQVGEFDGTPVVQAKTDKSITKRMNEFRERFFSSLSNAGSSVRNLLSSLSIWLISFHSAGDSSQEADATVNNAIKKADSNGVVKAYSFANGGGHVDVPTANTFEASAERKGVFAQELNKMVNEIQEDDFNEYAKGFSFELGEVHIEEQEPSDSKLQKAQEFCGDFFKALACCIDSNIGAVLQLQLNEDSSVKAYALTGGATSKCIVTKQHDQGGSEAMTVRVELRGPSNAVFMKGKEDQVQDCQLEGKVANAVTTFSLKFSKNTNPENPSPFSVTCESFENSYVITEAP